MVVALLRGMIENLQNANQINVISKQFIVKKMINSLLNENNIFGYTIRMTNTHRILAQVINDEKIFNISKIFIENNSIDVIKQVIKHEIAHILVCKFYYDNREYILQNVGIIYQTKDFKPHGKLFKNFCKQLNCTCNRATISCK